MPSLRVPLLAVALAASLSLHAASSCAQSPRGFPHPRSPVDPCRPDLDAPTATLTARVDGDRLRLDVEAADGCGLASVFVALDGDVVSGRVLPPWSFDLDAPVGAVEACALVTDRSGNSVLACASPAPEPEPCDGVDCAPDEYCARPVGDCGGAGHCEPRPEACTAEYDPACGCDGVTYGNACEAARAGTSVAHPGACE